jgi:hypothetical protein
LDAALGVLVPRTVSAVAVDELTHTVNLTLTPPVYADEMAYVAYVPGTAPIQNLAGLAAPAIDRTAAWNGSSVEIEGGDAP